MSLLFKTAVTYFFKNKKYLSKKSSSRNFDHVKVLHSEEYEGFTGKIIIPGTDSQDITKEIGPEKHFNCENIDAEKCSTYEQYEIFGAKIRIEKKDKTHIFNLTQSDKLIVDKSTSKDWIYPQK